jgi:hypothetical protein
MCKFSKKSGLKRIDPCMKPLIQWLNDRDYQVCACCCGHSVHKMSIIIKYISNGKQMFLELLSNTIIPRSKRFYRKDSKGYYYIPEVRR